MLQKPLVIRRGETVQVTYKSHSFAVTNVAKAQGDGGVGDMITLEVTSQGDCVNPSVVKRKIIHAQIVGPAMAQIVRAA
jgi:flagella basal body P-ring formation protein FlgA